MIFRNALRIFKDWGFSIIYISLYEIIYIILGFKGNSFNFSRNKHMSDDIPVPYYFLNKIRLHLKKRKFKTFMDFGSGSGRVIYYFSKSFKKKKFIGIEYFTKQYNHSLNLFNHKKNISFINKEFTKLNFLQYKPDCFFFNNPFRDEKKCVIFINKIISKLPAKRKITFIFCNFDKSILLKIYKLKRIKLFYVTQNKGFSIFQLN